LFTNFGLDGGGFTRPSLLAALVSREGVREPKKKKAKVKKSPNKEMGEMWR
jgi:hypothetical protein